jgi:hypothetical protein
VIDISPCRPAPQISFGIRSQAFVPLKLLLKVGLGIDRPTESTHRRSELPVAMCANSHDWSRTEPFDDSESALVRWSILLVHETESLNVINGHNQSQPSPSTGSKLLLLGALSFVADWSVA